MSRMDEKGAGYVGKQKKGRKYIIEKYGGIR